jgi:exosortase
MNSEEKVERTWEDDLQQFTPKPAVLAALAVLGVAFCLFYRDSFWVLLGYWKQPDYQHGPFVPLFSLFLLWWRRDMIIPFKAQGRLWGLAFFGLWALMRLLAVYFNFHSLPEMSIIPFFAGFVLIVGGRRMLLWAWPSLVFLCFMLPLPGDVQSVLSIKLQSIATKVSVFIIQTLGIPSVAEGNVIKLTDEPLEVAQACSGLRMMMMFFALCVGAAFVIKKPLWEKLLIIVSAIPIAILGNVGRIVVTAVCIEIVRRWPSLGDAHKVQGTIHDIAGFVIEMPLGMLLLWIEMTLLSKLLIPPLEEKPLMMAGLAAAKAPSTGRQGGGRGTRG